MACNCMRPDRNCEKCREMINDDRALLAWIQLPIEEQIFRLYGLRVEDIATE